MANKIKKNSKVMYEGHTWKVINIYENEGIEMATLSRDWDKFLYKIPLEDLFLIK